MALQKRVSELPAVAQVAGTDLLIVSSNNATKRTSVQQIGAYFAANGVISASSAYTLPAATTSSLGGVIVGSGLSVSSGTVSANVTSVAGRTGAVTIAAADVSGLAASATTDTTNASNISGGTLGLARLPVVVEKSSAIGNSGTATTLSLTTGSVQTVTLNGNCTFTMPSATAGASITLILTQSAAFTATFTGVLWSGGTAPTITATANKRDILVFVSDGTNWYGTTSQNH
ncbi:MAG: hypothetical protein EBR82_33695 [Caulobacteraceae bacterium]|nr:hypothetical protein [Caulobacteraceae bacterium]